MAAGHKEKSSLVQHLITFVLVVTIVLLVSNNWHYIKHNSNISVAPVATMVLCILATWLLSSIQLHALVKSAAPDARFIECLEVTIAAILLNYAPLRPGTALKFVYFKKRHGISFSQFAGFTVLRFMLLLIVSTIMGAVALANLFDDATDQSRLLTYFLIATAATTIGALIASITLRTRLVNILPSAFGRFRSGISVSREYPELAGIVLICLIGQILLLAIRLDIAFIALGRSPSLAVIMALAPMTMVVSFVSITPGNLGLREWIIGLTSAALGLPFIDGIVVASTDRVALVFCTVVLGGLCTVRIRKKMGSTV